MDGRPFISGAPFYPSKTDSYEQIHPCTLSLHHLSPYGTPITPIDPTRSLWICLQNTQFAFQLYNDRINLSQIIESLICLNAQMFVPISLNINWNNPSNWVRTKTFFLKAALISYFAEILFDYAKQNHLFHQVYNCHFGLTLFAGCRREYCTRHG